MRGATAYYNEIDPFAAAWLRALIDAGQIAPGVVDQRDIRDVRPDELAGFTQCHFFAGIGVWSHALRNAGWPDNRPIWTGSCPCQPFSAAGKGEGFADERHLWPSFYHLIEQCEPPVVAGEQVAGGGVDEWFDLVQADLEAMGYAFGLVPLPAAGFGGAHIRDRGFWVAYAASSGQPGPSWGGNAQEQRIAELCGAGWLADANCDGAGYGARESLGAQAAADGGDRRVSGQCQRPRVDSAFRGLAAAQCERHDGRGNAIGKNDPQGWRADAARPAPLGHNRAASAPMLGRNAADWLFCRDGKWRPVEPGTFPLAHETTARVGRLRGYGNAIDAETLTQFLIAVGGHIDGRPPHTPHSEVQ